MNQCHQPGVVGLEFEPALFAATDVEEPVDVDQRPATERIGLVDNFPGWQRHRFEVRRQNCQVHRQIGGVSRKGV